MNKQQIATGKAPSVAITAHGDLAVRIWQENAVRWRGADIQVDEGEEQLTLTAHSSAVVRVPAGASLTVVCHSNCVIKGVGGDLLIAEAYGNVVIKNAGAVHIKRAHANVVVKGVDRLLTIGEVSGDLVVRNVSEATVGTVHGDCLGRNVHGSVTVESVAGDVSWRTVGGDLHIRRGHRDANIRNLGGRLQLDEIMGDVRLRDGLTIGDHHVKAHGDIVLRWPADAPLALTAKASSFDNRLELLDKTEKEGFMSGRLGDGGVNLNLTAEGRVVLKPAYEDSEFAREAGAWDVDFQIDLEDKMAGLGDLISSQIESGLSQMSVHLEHHLGPEIAQRMADRASRKAERAVERAVRHMERTRRRATRPSPAPASKKDVGQEQLQILKMLEKGIISTEEANALLEAL